MLSSKGSNKPKSVKSKPGDSASGPKKWVVVQLSQTGEREKNISVLERSAKRLVGPVDVFVPAASKTTHDGVRDDSNTMFYMDGYVFLEFKEGISYGRLFDTTYFQSVLMAGRKYHLVDDSEIAPLRKGVKAMAVGSFVKGDHVKVVKGTLKNLVGVVSSVYDGKEVVQVSAGLISKPYLMDFHSSYLIKL